jgi:hypothetical protein
MFKELEKIILKVIGTLKVCFKVLGILRDICKNVFFKVPGTLKTTA